MSNQEIKDCGNGGCFIDRHRWLPLTVVGIYLALLALGTVGEVFHIDWILNIPIFKGP